MAIDFLIFALLLISFVINLLALGAFWVTPGLRTTANRFTINLLIINLIGCLILAPTLFLTNSTGFTRDYDGSSIGSSLGDSTLTAAFSDDSIEFYSKPGNHQMTIRHNGKLVEQDGIILRRNFSTSDGGNSQDPRTVETIYKCNNTYCQELTIDQGSDTIVITEIEEENHRAAVTATEKSLPELLLMPNGLNIRCWSIDMAAALGALAVLLVVGDTWCAVTDPLRYHSRISGVKAWIFIALTWALGILFGALSALRELDFEADSLLSKQKRFAATYSEEEAYFSLSSSNNIFGFVFAGLYFVVIILLPFGFVCGMYWRIFSEARENGLRMRQNGSSPLLQSALNLTHHQQASSLQYSNSLCVHRQSISSASSHGGGGLQMSIDHQRKSSPACHRRDSAAKVLLPTISDDGVSDEADAESTNGQLVPVPEQPTPPPNTLADRNQNILLTLQSASGEIKRNYSARQLPLLGTSSQDLRELHNFQGIRQVHSSPNLQKYTQVRQDSLTEEQCSPHLLGHHQLQHVYQHRHQNHLHSHLNHHNNQHQHHSHVLQIPAIHGSPKALSYMSSLRHRLSNASSLFKYREESRAARISILVVIMFLVSYLPYGVLVLLQSRLSAANFKHSTQLAIFMLLLGNLSSPFIFAYRNKRVRRGVKRLLGLDKHCRERSLQRQSSSSGRGSGFLQRHSSGAQRFGGSANIKRTGSKVSTYSSNSCKYLTPQSSLASNGGAGIPPNFTPVHHSTLALRPNSSCSTIINFGLSKKSGDCADSDCGKTRKTTAAVDATEQQQNGNITSPQHCESSTDERCAEESKAVRPKLQRGITIVEHIPLDSKLTSKRTILKQFFQSSKSLSCAAAKSCAEGIEAEAKPTEV